MYKLKKRRNWIENPDSHGKRTMDSDRKCGLDAGFTLVELIIVLVILAILAAVLLPALMGYIDRAREKKEIYEAKACLDATQAQFTELYGKTIEVKEGVPVVSGAQYHKDSNNEDQDICNTEFAKNVFRLVDLAGDENPYCFMVAVGSNAKNNSSKKCNVTRHDKFTVYYAFYMKTENSEPLYYYNGEWTRVNPRMIISGTNSSNYKFSDEFMNGDNIIQKGPLKNKRLQYYVISNQTKYPTSIQDGNFWNWLKGMKE